MLYIVVFMITTQDTAMVQIFRHSGKTAFIDIFGSKAPLSTITKFL